MPDVIRQQSCKRAASWSARCLAQHRRWMSSMLILLYAVSTSRMRLVVTVRQARPQRSSRGVMPSVASRAV